MAGAGARRQGGGGPPLPVGRGVAGGGVPTDLRRDDRGPVAPRPRTCPGRVRTPSKSPPMPVFVIERRFADDVDVTAEDADGVNRTDSDEGVRWLY